MVWSFQTKRGAPEERSSKGHADAQDGTRLKLNKVTVESRRRHH
jgi:hypothetical protein